MTTETSLQSLTSYDWVNTLKDTKTIEDVVELSEQNYEEGVQRLKVVFSDGSSVIQTRRWRDDESHTGWVDCFGGDIRSAMAIVEKESFLLKENLCEPMKTGTDLDNFLRDIYNPQWQDVEVSSEAFCTEDEIEARAKQYLAENNLRVDENNLLGYDVDPDRIHELALEFRAIDTTVQGFMLAVKSKFQQVTNAFSAYSNNIVRVKNFNYDGIKVRKLAGNIQNVPYSLLVDFGVYCAPGQTVPYLNLLDTLQLVGKNSIDSIETDLKAFISAIGYLVNNPQALSGARKVLGTPSVDIGKMKSNLAKCFGNSSTTNVPYSLMVERNTDWSEIKTGCDKLLDLYDSCPPKSVKAMVDGVTANLDNIYRSTMNGEEIASKQNLEVLADWCFHAAQLVEFYAAFTNVLRTLMVAIDDSATKLTKFAKNVK